MIGVEFPDAAGGGRAFALRCHVLSSVGERELFRSLLIDVTVAHLVFQNYVADYINIPCFSTFVKEPTTYLSMFRPVCQLDLFRVGEIHAWSSRSEISSCNRSQPFCAREEYPPSFISF